MLYKRAKKKSFHTHAKTYTAIQVRTRISALSRKEAYSLKPILAFEDDYHT